MRNETLKINESVKMYVKMCIYFLPNKCQIHLYVKSAHYCSVVKNIRNCNTFKEEFLIRKISTIAEILRDEYRCL